MKPKKLLNSCIRLCKLSMSLGVKNGFKLALFARLTNGIVKLDLKSLRHPFYIRGKTTDDTVVEQIFADGEYPVLKGLKPRRIIDAGANCGAASAYFAAIYPTAEIVAIEPEESNFRLLHKNLSALRAVRLLKGALWCSDSQLMVSNAGSPKYAFEIKPLSINVDATFVPAKTVAYTIPEIMKQQKWDRVDLLKLDIEGSELALFERNFETWLGKVDTIFIELHEENAPGCGKAFFSALSALDYQVDICGEHLVIRLSPVKADGSEFSIRNAGLASCAVEAC